MALSSAASTQNSGGVSGAIAVVIVLVIFALLAYGLYRGIRSITTRWRSRTTVRQPRSAVRQNESDGTRDHAALTHHVASDPTDGSPASAIVGPDEAVATVDPADDGPRSPSVPLQATPREEPVLTTPAENQVIVGLEVPDGKLENAYLEITPPGHKAPLRFPWRQDSFETADGVEIMHRGFEIGDHRDPDAVPGCLTFQLAGGTYRSAVLNQTQFLPGHPVLLIPEPSNPVDKYAVGVWDEAGDYQAGYVPREHSRELAERLNGQRASGFVAIEWRRRDRRIGLTILTGGSFDDGL